MPPPWPSGSSWRRLSKRIAPTPTRPPKLRSKKKQLDRLQLLELESDEKTVAFHVPQDNIRRGTAVRCSGLAIGYPDHTVASHIDLEIEHGTCTVVVGDNGQGKTTILRTLVDSLPPLAGEVRWGYGCQIGIYAQHVYSSLPADQTIRQYLDGCRGPDTTTQTVLDIAGSFLFQGDLVDKRIEVLSGGERARLCLAGLLLAPHNVLVLDEPGNHLDVETVDALADALNQFEGTVILTSHDRHFVHRVANSVIEIGDGKATHYPSSYDSYLYRVEKEFDHDPATAVPAAERKSSGPASQRRKNRVAEQRSVRKQVASLERKIAELDDRKRSLQQQLLATTDASQAERLHEQVQQLQSEIEAVEQRWFELQETAESQSAG